MVGMLSPRLFTVWDSTGKSDGFTSPAYSCHLTVASEILYLALLRIHAINGAESVLSFLAILAALFILYGSTARLLERGGHSLCHSLHCLRRQFHFGARD